MKHLIFSALLLIAVACGSDNDKKSSSPGRTPQAEQNPVCESLECKAQATWRVAVEGRNFPDRSRIEVNDVVVLDECVSKQSNKIDRTVTPQTLVLENYLVPRVGQVKIHIVDQGADCEENTTFLLNDNVDFAFVNAIAGAEVIINL
jgi:hypothetical protein